jgi:hypothetical protein
MDNYILHRAKLRLNKAVVRCDPHDWKRDGLIKSKRCRHTPDVAHVTQSSGAQAAWDEAISTL